MYEHIEARPWYRQFWPWFLMAIPAAGVFAGVGMVVVANQSPDGVVVDDYYKRGLAINRDLARDQKAAVLGVNAELRLPHPGLVQVALEGQETALLPALTLRLLHPTKAGQDQTLILQRTGTGLFEADLEHLQPANWHVLIEPPARDWRLQDRLQWPQTSTATLRASAGD